MLSTFSFLDHLRIQNLEAEVEQLKAQRLIAEAKHRSKVAGHAHLLSFTVTLLF